MLDKRVITPITNGIRPGMLVVPRSDGTRTILWRGSMTSPGLVLDVIITDESRLTVAAVLVNGGRLIVPTESLIEIPTSEEPTEELPAPNT